jgi:biotin synthase
VCGSNPRSIEDWSRRWYIAETRVVMSYWSALADGVLDGVAINREEALALANAPDDELLAVLHAAFKIRSRFHGRKVRLHLLQNAKSGVCPEDCTFCSQSLRHASAVEQYGMQSVEELVEGADNAHGSGAVTYCIATATRGPSAHEIDTVCSAVASLKQKYPLKVCVSLGLLKPGQAERLREAGVDRYNHNLETSRRYFPSIVTTHSWEDRFSTLTMARTAGLEICSGGIIGMGEAPEDRVDLALALREISPESVPLNFLDPRPGTPLAETMRLTPQECLKALAMFRFVHREADVRLAGGREAALDKMQPLALYAANSIFTSGYLTTAGQGVSEDYKLIAQAGFVSESADSADQGAPSSGSA